ncbi:MAG: hypothetical protein IIW34_03810 [Clostridia bacterium]|nr:hypothetical protein [Clostridia bacterium]
MNNSHDNLDRLIDKNISEARSLWLDTLPHSDEIPKHDFPARFRLKIRRISGMKYTLLHLGKLALYGIVAVFMGLIATVISAIPIAAPLLFTVDPKIIAICNGIISVIISFLAAWVLQNIWYRLGESARARELPYPALDILAVLAIPIIFIIASFIGASGDTIATSSQGVVFGVFGVSLLPFQILFGFGMLGRIFPFYGMILWLAVMGVVFYAGMKDISLKKTFKWLKLAAIPAGVYDGLTIMGIGYNMMPFLKAAYLLLIIITITYFFKELGMKTVLIKITAAILAVCAIAAMFFDLTPDDGTEGKLLSPFSDPSHFDEIFPDFTTAPISIRCGSSESAFGGTYISLSPDDEAEIRELLNGVILKSIYTSPSYTGTKKVMLHIESEAASADIIIYSALDGFAHVDIHTDDESKSFNNLKIDDLDVLNELEERILASPDENAAVYMPQDSLDGYHLSAENAALLQDAINDMKSISAEKAEEYGYSFNCRLELYGESWLLDSRKGVFLRESDGTYYRTAKYLGGWLTRTEDLITITVSFDLSELYELSDASILTEQPRFGRDAGFYAEYTDVSCTEKDGKFICTVKVSDIPEYLFIQAPVFRYEVFENDRYSVKHYSPDEYTVSPEGMIIID